jgi:hypothetical protein
MLLYHLTNSGRSHPEWLILIQKAPDYAVSRVTAADSL